MGEFASFVRCRLAKSPKRVIGRGTLAVLHLLHAKDKARDPAPDAEHEASFGAVENDAFAPSGLVPRFAFTKFLCELALHSVLPRM
jgi:hypothetical protein